MFMFTNENKIDKKKLQVFSVFKISLQVRKSQTPAAIKQASKMSKEKKETQSKDIRWFIFKET